MQRGLYDIVFLSILKELNNGKILLESLASRLSSDILEEFKFYLNISPMKILYKSIIDNRSIELIKYILNMVENTTYQSQYNIYARALVLAIETQRKDIIDLMSDKFPWNINLWIDNSHSIIHLINAAISNNNLHLFKKLHKTFFNIISPSNWSKFLGLAVYIQNNRVIKFIMNKIGKYNIHIVNDFALAKAIKLNDKFLIEKFHDNIQNWDIILAASIVTNNNNFINFVLNSNIVWSLKKAVRKAVKVNNTNFINILVKNYNLGTIVFEALIAAAQYKNSIIFTQFYNIIIQSKLGHNFNLTSNFSFLHDCYQPQQFREIVIGAIKGGNKILLQSLLSKEKILPEETVNTYILNAIEYGQFYLIDILIPEIPYDFEVSIYSQVMINYLNEVFLPLNKEHDDITDLLILAKQGYCYEKTIKNIIGLDADTFKGIKINKFKYKIKHIVSTEQLKLSLEQIPSLYSLEETNSSVFISLQGTPIYMKKHNIEQLSTATIMKNLNRDYYTLTLTDLNLICFLNKFVKESLSEETFNLLKTDEIQKTAWKEYCITRAYFNLENCNQNYKLEKLTRGINLNIIKK